MPEDVRVDVAHLAPATDRLIANAYVIYALLALGLLFAIPSIVALVMVYLQRSKVHGTFLEMHVRWQIRTVWSAVAWMVTSLVFVVTIILSPLGLILWFVTFLWVVYRIVRGWQALGRRQPVFPLRSVLD